MKAIFRSPIEPEFAELVVKTIGEQRARLLAYARESTERVKSVMYAAKIRTRFTWIRRREQFLALWSARRLELKAWLVRRPNGSQEEFSSDHSENAEKENYESTWKRSPFFVPDNLDLEREKTGQPAPEPRQPFQGGSDSGDSEKNEEAFALQNEKRYRSLLIVLLVIGILVGIFTKSAARDRIMIGFEDYKVNRASTTIDLNALEQKVIQSPVAAPLQAVGEQCTE